jgi:serine phosphatase RsbU (regulator of sigma subunit)
MTREEALQIVRELWAAANARDTARVMRLYSDDAVLVSPVWGHVTDRNAIMKTWDDTFKRFPDMTVTVDDILVDGERVTFLAKAGATDHNGWFGQAPTGEWFEYRTATSLTFREGKIVHDERVYDLTSLLQRFEKTRLDKELQMAADVQRALLSHSTHVTPYCEAAGDSIPCRAIGGDFFELVKLPSGNFCGALGDVAGKGPASALLASMIQGMLAIELNGESSPAAVLGRLNRVLFHRGLKPRFATLVYGILSADGRFVYANAGHNPPMLLSGDLIQRLTSGGPVLGTFQESAYQEETLRLQHGNSLVLFSDGVSEATNTHGEEFGEDRLVASAKSSASSSAGEMLQRILGAVQEFCKGAPQSDDITAAVV